MRRWVACWCVAAALALVLPAAASAAGPLTSMLGGDTISGTAISCTAQSDGVRACDGDYSGSGGADTRLKSFDGSPLQLYVILPPAPASGSDGSYPLIVQSHGWGGSAGGPSQNDYSGPTGDGWAKQGYAVLQLTARGFGDSCGSAASRTAAPTACASGYIRLDDDRYEVRDVQYAIGLLADAGIVNPGKIGVTGPSYGGGVSLQLATLKDRVMNADGSLSSWKSPNGAPLAITAAAPVIPWSDLTYSLMPNGRTLDTQITSPTADLSPLGVEKQSFVSGLYALGQLSGYYSTPGTNSQADLTTWFAALNTGEPYDANTEDESIATTIARYHSAYYLLDGAYGTAQEQPAPLLIANGFTDDLFPVDEAIRYYNLERSLYPDDPISLFDFDGGHQRGQNKPGEATVLSNEIQSFFDHYLKGTGSAPGGATAMTQTCPASVPAGGPFAASSWAALHPGEVDLTSASAQTITSGAGSPMISQAIDPISGQGACASVSAADQGNGVASYRLPAATGDGYTLLGAPTVSAALSVTGAFPVIAERLWDVDPASSTETLVARGVYRVSGSGNVVFQFHPGGWHFAAGHVAKLELLSQDAPYVRTSNGQFSISVSDLELQLAVHETPGSGGIPGGVSKPSPPSGGAKRCIARPSSRITKHGVRVSSKGFSLSGSASEKPCANAPAASRHKERVRRVWVSVYRGVGNGRCRFVRSNGHLGRRRSCFKPLSFRAHGTAHWHLRRKLHLAPGRYVIRADAVDFFRRHQRRTAASAVRLAVR